MAKTGPKGPTKPLNDADFDKLLNMIRIQCTRDEIAGIFEMSDTTLNRRLKERGEANFEALYEKYSKEGKASLRREQWKAAQKGNPAMLIWLGKQMLGQKDISRQEHTGKDGGPIETQEASPRDRIISRLNRIVAAEAENGGSKRVH